MGRGILKEYATTFDALSRLLDPAIVAIVTYAFWEANIFMPPELAWTLAVYTVPLVFFIFPLFRIYRSWRFSSIVAEGMTVLIAWLAVILSFNLLMIILANPQQRSILLPYALFVYKPYLLWALAVYITIAFSRAGLRTLLRFARREGYNIRTALFVGFDKYGKDLANFFKKNSWMGVKIRGFLDDSGTDDSESVPLLGTINDLEKFADEVDMVFIDLPMKEEEKLKVILTTLTESTASVYLLPDIFTFDFVINTSFMDIGGIPTVALRSSPFTGMNKLLKRLEDLVIGPLILVFSLPLMAVAAIGIKLTSPGPIIFRQKRCGLNGDEILVYKFRTMNTADANPAFKDVTKDDPRVTSFGAFLRKFSIDELPQLFNVLLGNMSLVGPRPHPLAFNDEYKKMVPGYMLRHQVKPGLTGLAQVNGYRGETDTLEKLEKRIEYDLLYLNSWSVFQDLKIIFLTAIRFLRQPTAY